MANRIFRNGKPAKPSNSNVVLGELLADGNWFRFMRGFLAVMTPDEAILYAYLINHANVCRANDADGWFYCHAERIGAYLFFSTDKQTRLFSKLRNRGFLETEQRGIPAQRYIRLDLARVVKQALAAMRSVLPFDDDAP